MSIKKTFGGPIMVPIQCVRVRSFSSAKPQLIVPSPSPFIPSSNSSRRTKFLGTTKYKIYTYKVVIHFSLTNRSSYKLLRN